METKVDVGIAETIKEVRELDTVREADKTTALIPRAIHAALAPLEVWILNKEYNIEKTKLLLSQKLKDIPEKNIITPPAYIGVPALQAISYCMDDDELREMYAGLLKSAMNIDTVDNVHPTYVEIIKQMSPFDAVLFRNLAKALVKPCISVSYKEKNSGASYPIQDIVAFNDMDKYPLVPTQIALENLERMRLIEINRKAKYANEGYYEVLIDGMKPVVTQFIEANESNMKPDEYEAVFDKFTITVRGFGQFFARACMGMDFRDV